MAFEKNDTTRISDREIREIWELPGCAGPVEFKKVEE